MPFFKNDEALKNHYGRPLRLVMLRLPEAMDQWSQAKAALVQDNPDMPALSMAEHNIGIIVDKNNAGLAVAAAFDESWYTSTSPVMLEPTKGVLLGVALSKARKER